MISFGAVAMLRSIACSRTWPWCGCAPPERGWLSAFVGAAKKVPQTVAFADAANGFYEPNFDKCCGLNECLHKPRWCRELQNQRCNIRPSKTYIASIATIVSCVWPIIALGDHVPDNLSQQLNPNYIGCMMAVDDAEREFRDELQSTCLSRMGNICSGRAGVAVPSQVIDCVHFEKQRSLEFLRTAVANLPDEVEKTGFFGHGYQRRRESILEDIESLQNQTKPQTIDVAIDQTVIMASAVIMLFWLARETATPVEAHVPSTFGHH